MVHEVQNSSSNNIVGRNLHMDGSSATLMQAFIRMLIRQLPVGVCAIM
jgi:hypothetical protein